MIQLKTLQRKSKMPEADYVLDKFEQFLSLLDVLTPKFKGNWEIVLVDLKVKEAQQIIDTITVPEFIVLTLLMPANKIEPLVLEHPNLAPKQLSVKDAYKEMITTLKHMIDKNAMWDLYQAVGPHLSALQEALSLLDSKCEGPTIDRKLVRKEFLVQRRTYASDVLSAFFRRDRYRWTKLSNLTRELGDDYAYNALYKQVRELLQNKDKYLHNEDVKGRLVEQVDAPLICYAYVLFTNSSSWKNLHGVMYDLDKRCEESLERSMYVNIQ